MGDRVVQDSGDAAAKALQQQRHAIFAGRLLLRYLGCAILFCARTWRVDMALLDRGDWYDVARTTNWTPRYASEQEIFPDEMSDMFGLSCEQWEAFDEPYKVSYREYVDVQSTKDKDTYSVRAALARSNYYEQADPGWRSILKLHFGAICLGEYVAMVGEAKMARFGKASGWRNMSTLGCLDEIRHTQMQLFFAHDYVGKDRQFDFAHKMLHTNGWAPVAARLAFDDTIQGRDAANIAVMLTFGTEQGFTNLQFLGLAADAANAGDYTFSNMCSSVQTDEARHSQIGEAAMKVLIANGKKEQVQRSVDLSFWRNWRLFFTLTGPATDYHTPVESREKSFKEFVEEYIIRQFERAIIDLGLDKPWYWDLFLDSINYSHHSAHLVIWFVRKTVFWNPAASVGPRERAWLEEKYPGWGKRWGPVWDVIAENVRNGREDLIYPQALPMLCNICGLAPTGYANSGHNCRGYSTDWEGRRYNFCSPVCQWIFEGEPERYRDHTSIVDRFVAGEIQPKDFHGVLDYFDIAPGEQGDDAHDYAWAWPKNEQPREDVV
jgi:toluene monooxygenase system protein A